MICHLIQSDEAEKEIRKSIDFMPNGAEEHNSLAIILAEYPKRMDKARKEYEEALIIIHNYLDALLRFACWYSVKGNLENSIEYFKKAIQINIEYDKEKAKQDNGFINIRHTREFKKIVSS